MTRLNIGVRGYWIQRFVPRIFSRDVVPLEEDERKKKKEKFHERPIESIRMQNIRHVSWRFNSSTAFLQGLLAEVALPQRFNARPSPWTFHGSFEYYAFVDIPGERIGSILWSTARKKILRSPSVRVTEAHVSTECQTFRQPFMRRWRRSIKLRAMDHTYAVQSCKRVMYSGISCGDHETRVYRTSSAPTVGY